MSLDRARECIGRTIQHIDGIKLKGQVTRVTQYDVWVSTTDGDEVPCIPENMEWVPSLPYDIREAIEEGESYTEDAQLRYSHNVTNSDDDDDQWFEELHVVYSPAATNDNGCNHPLYIIAEGIQRVYLGRRGALPDGAWEIEELLGWAQP